MTYNKWLKTQSTEFQNKALGKERAAEFRNGVRVEKFKEHGKPLSLDELNETNDISINGE